MSQLPQFSLGKIKQRIGDDSEQESDEEEGVARGVKSRGNGQEDDETERLVTLNSNYYIDLSRRYNEMKKLASGFKHLWAVRGAPESYFLDVECRK